MNSDDASDLAAFRLAFPNGVPAAPVPAVLQQPVQVNAVSVQIPPFWSHDPESWFRRIEAQFDTRGIVNDKTKVNYVIGSIDASIHREMGPTFDSLPDSNGYAVLRAAIIKNYGPTQAQKDAELFAMSGLGDRDPMALGRRIKALTSDLDTLRKAFLLAQLPLEMRRVLGDQSSSLSFDDLCAAAKRVHDATAHLNPINVSAVSTLPLPPAPHQLFEPTPYDQQLQQQYQNPSYYPQTVSAVQPGSWRGRGGRGGRSGRGGHQASGQHQPTGQQQTGGQQQQKAPPQPGYSSPLACHIHAKYGAQARFCRGPPCPHFQGN